MDVPSTARRRVLCAAVSAALLCALPLPRAEASLSCGAQGWRYCGKCHSMFFHARDPGVCTDGKPHLAQGYNFVLPCDRAETPTAQRRWRRCRDCSVLFFNGYRDKGHCPANARGHVSDGSSDYVLPHDVPGTPTAQTQWRFCDKCHGMFYDGYADKGRCPAGGGHRAQGYDFVLPHVRPR